jgi:hypothetical protein
MSMSAQHKLKNSRKNWKGKAIDRGDTVRYLQKENKRLKLQHQRDKKDLVEIKVRLEAEQKNNIPRLVNNKASLVFFSLQLFLVARISFRAVSRVLSVLGSVLGIQWVPSHQTIINWLLRLSIVKMQSIPKVCTTTSACDPFSNGYIWLVDISIGLGAGKILTVLALDAQHHRMEPGAATLNNVHCVGVAVASSWTGADIANFFKKIIGTLGRPIAYLKDGGADLRCAARLLAEEGFVSPCIDDVSHKIANLVKHEYGKHPLFALFLSTCGKVSKRLKQTIIACLAPPKVSMKARFMNLHRLVHWADKILKHSIVGPAQKGSLLEKLRTSLHNLPECEAFITCFIRDTKPLMACQSIIKNHGLNHDTYAQCQKLIETIPPSSSIRIGFNEWAIQQLDIAQAIGMNKVGLPISTDQLESLYGTAKHHGTGEIKDANRIAMRLPALCGTFTMDEAEKVLNITVQQQQELMTADTLFKQRQQVLAHPGTLETLLSRSENKQIELLPLPKNREKIDVTHCNIYDINKFNGPVSEVKDMPIYKSPCIFNSLVSRENQEKTISFFDG